MRGAEGQAQLQQRFRGLNPQPERSEPRRSALLASAAGTAATPERDKRSWPRGRGCAVSRKPKTPPKSVLNHEGAPWPRSLLGMGTLVSAVRQRSAPGATANRRSFAETTANCSQLGPRREYSPAHGTSPNAFRRMARNGGTHPAEAGKRRTWSRLLQAPPGSHGSSSRDGAGIRGSRGIPAPPRCQPRAPFCPSPAVPLPLAAPKAAAPGTARAPGQHQPDPATRSHHRAEGTRGCTAARCRPTPRPGSPRVPKNQNKSLPGLGGPCTEPSRAASPGARLDALRETPAPGVSPKAGDKTSQVLQSPEGQGHSVVTRWGSSRTRRP